MLVVKLPRVEKWGEDASTSIKGNHPDGSV